MKTTVVVGLVALGLLVVVGCAHSTGMQILKVNTGVTSSVHPWEEPHFTADLTSNPASSELGLGFVTVGSHLGCADQDKWIDASFVVGPAVPEVH